MPEIQGLELQKVFKKDFEPLKLSINQEPIIVAQENLLART